MQENELWKKIYSGNGKGRDIYVLDCQYAAWETIQREHNGNYYLTSVLRAVYALNSIAVPRRPWALLRRRGLEKLSFDGAAIHYSLDNDGNVRIRCLEVNSDYKPHSGQQTTGLYRVEKRRGKWATSDTPKTKMELNHRWHDGSHYAAVSGKFDDKEQAGRRLIEHIRNAYKGAVKKEDISRSNIHYSLYWQNGGFKSDKHRDHLVSLIQHAIRVGSRVNWLVHGEGAGTFVRALQILEKQLSPVPVPETSKRETKLRKYFERQSVYFSNPRGAGTREKELKALCDQVGIDFAGINTNPYDMLNADSRNHVLTKGTAIAGATYFGGEGAVLGTKAVADTFNHAISAQSVGIAAGALIAGYFVVRDKIKTNSGYVRALPRTISSTFGKGNQRWAA